MNDLQAVAHALNARPRKTLGWKTSAAAFNGQYGSQRNKPVLHAAYALYRERSVGPRDLESRLFRRAFSHPTAPIRFVGVWDTVGALGIRVTGIPGIEQVNRLWGFHDTRLSSTVPAAYQALAIDEHRQAFTPSVWQPPAPDTEHVVEQVWFAGSHCDVGVGYRATGLSDLALGWLADRAEQHGLALTVGAFRADGLVISRPRWSGSPPTRTACSTPPAPACGGSCLLLLLLHDLGEHCAQRVGGGGPGG